MVLKRGQGGGSRQGVSIAAGAETNGMLKSERSTSGRLAGQADRLGCPMSAITY